MVGRAEGECFMRLGKREALILSILSSGDLRRRELNPIQAIHPGRILIGRHSSPFVNPPPAFLLLQPSSQGMFSPRCHHRMAVKLSVYVSGPRSRQPMRSLGRLPVSLLRRRVTLGPPQNRPKRLAFEALATSRKAEWLHRTPIGRESRLPGVAARFLRIRRR